jgi:hypothetical protein
MKAERKFLSSSPVRSWGEGGNQKLLFNGYSSEVHGDYDCTTM